MVQHTDGAQTLLAMSDVMNPLLTERQVDDHVS